MDVVIGEPFTVQTLYLNSTGTPFVPISPTVTIFYFNSSGTKIILTGPVAANPVTPSETGRYTLTYTIPDTVSDGTSGYAEFQATDPISSNSLVDTQALNFQSRSPLSGMGVSFVA